MLKVDSCMRRTVLFTYKKLIGIDHHFSCSGVKHVIDDTLSAHATDVFITIIFTILVECVCV